MNGSHAVDKHLSAQYASKVTVVRLNLAMRVVGVEYYKLLGIDSNATRHQHAA